MIDEHAAEGGFAHDESESCENHPYASHDAVSREGYRGPKAKEHGDKAPDDSGPFPRVFHPPGHVAVGSRLLPAPGHRVREKVLHPGCLVSDRDDFHSKNRGPTVSSILQMMTTRP